MNPNIPPNGSYGPNLFRALRGPVMMMALGAVLALDHFTRFGFGETWPLLLIVFGAITLADHTIGRQPRPSGSPYSGV